MAFHQLTTGLLNGSRNILLCSSPKLGFYHCAATLKCLPLCRQKLVSNTLKTGVIKSQGNKHVPMVVCGKLCNPFASNSAFSTSSKSFIQWDEIGKQLNNIRRMYRSEKVVANLQLILAGGFALYLMVFMWNNRKQAREHLEAARQSHQRILRDLNPVIQLKDIQMNVLPQPVGENNDANPTKKNKDAGSNNNVLEGLGSKTIMLDSVDSKNKIADDFDSSRIGDVNITGSNDSESNDHGYDSQTNTALGDISLNKNLDDDYENIITIDDNDDAHEDDNDDNLNVEDQKETDDETEDESVGFVAILDQGDDDDDDDDDE